MQQITLRKRKLEFQAQEAFKTLRTNIEFSGEELKVIAVTSCLPDEGKSTLAFQLALAFAEKGKKTLLVDADLRKSVMQKVSASGSVKIGLTSFLVGKEKLMDVLVGTDEPNFFMIFAGQVPPNPSELLGSGRFESMLEAAKKTFDIVIIDTPPVGSVIDGVIVSSRADGVVLVMKHASISYQLARRVKEQLSAAGTKLLGVALNGIGGRGSGFYGKYYGKHYGGKYYGGYGGYGGKYYGGYGSDSSQKSEVPDEDKDFGMDLKN